MPKMAVPQRSCIKIYRGEMENRMAHCSMYTSKIRMSLFRTLRTRLLSGKQINTNTTVRKVVTVPFIWFKNHLSLRIFNFSSLHLKLGVILLKLTSLNLR